MLAVLMACSGKKNAAPEIVDIQNGQLAEALNRGDYKSASVLADSMSLYVDDLEPDEVVSVLLAFLEFHNKAQGEDLETVRKFVDVYDIAVGENPNDMRAAFRKAQSMNPNLNFEQTAKDFRRALAEYDALRTYGETPVAEPDSAAKDSAEVKVDKPAPEVE